MNKAVREEQRLHALAFLLQNISPGTVIYAVIRNRSRSGMERHVSFFCLAPEPEGLPGIVDISHYMAVALQMPRNLDNGGIKVRGCGFNAAAHVVDQLEHVLFPEHKPGVLTTVTL